MTPEATAAREAVRRVWPGASAVPERDRNMPLGGFIVVSSMGSGGVEFGRGPTKDAAWISAAGSLPREVGNADG